MGSPTFGMVPGNNAPQPFSFAGNNPTGGLVNSGNKGVNSNFPNYPMFGPMDHGMVTPSANAPLFGSGGMQGMNSAFSPGDGKLGGNSLKEFQRAYGKGTGDALYNLIYGSGLFNPKTASAFLNAMQPGVNKGEADLMGSFGAEGSRFSSTAAFGEGNYLSQVNLNEQQTLASMFMQAQQEQLNLLSGALPTLHDEEANSGGGMWSDIIGGLEIAGGVAADIFTAGAAIPLTMPLITSGASTLASGLSNKGGSGHNASAPSMMMPGTQMGQTPPFLPGNSVYKGPGADDMAFWDKYDRDALDASGGASLFGSTGNAGNDFAVPFN